MPMKLRYLLLGLLLPGWSFTQSLQIPEVSPRTEIRQNIGLTQTTLEYSRPHIKGRRIFGHLIPYNQVWRTGANAATRIHFDQSVQIGDTVVAPGTYSLFTIPGQTTWTWIVNRDTTLWGTRGYDPDLDVVRVEASAKKRAQRTPSLHLFWQDITPQRAELTLQWAYTEVSLPVQFFTDRQVAEQITQHLGPDAPPNDYYRAARYYLENDLDLAQAQQWMNTWLQRNGPQFGILRYKALIEYDLGLRDEALNTLQQSLGLARKAGNDHYVRMNEATLRKWTRTVVAELSAPEVLDKSIQYHDPYNNWASGAFQLRLYEKRPSGMDRFTRLVINNTTGLFSLDQQRGPHHLIRTIGPDTCGSALNGRTTLTPEETQLFRMTCSRHQFYSDYYGYLYGLPMKLRDPGTRIDEQVWLETFDGDECLTLRVTYEPDVGGDIWYFYFDPKTYALQGYRFFHDEAANDGEYILLEKEVTIRGVRFPAIRHWHYNRDHQYLGTDQLLSY